MPSGRASPIAPGFETVRKVRRYEQVAEQIRRLISDGALKAGVGRSSIRDAVRTLEVMGILEPRQGHGTVVRDLSADALVVPLSLVLTRKRELVTELLDVRRMIEPGLAARAAKNATAEEIAHMSAILARHEAKLHRGEEAMDEDSDFHYAIALAARNSVVLRVLDVLMDLLRESRSRSLQVAVRPQRSFDGHRRILRALQRRDSKAAEAAVRRHLKEIEEVVMRQL